MTTATADWASDVYTSAARPVFVGGVPRSGTTLVSLILNAHPELVCGPEADLLRCHPCVGRMPAGLPRWLWHTAHGWTGGYGHLAELFGISLWQIRQMRLRSASGAEFIDRFFGEYARRHGVTRWAEKSPANVKCLDFVFEHFPAAHFLHVIRDGRDMACSLRQWITRRAESGEQGQGTNGKRPYTIAEGIELWVEWVRLGRAWANHPNYIELRYEELVVNPEPVLRSLCDAIDLEWDPALMDYHDRQHAARPELSAPAHAATHRPISPAAVRRWQRDLSREERIIVENIAGPMLRELNYTSSAGWVDG